MTVSSKASIWVGWGLLVGFVAAQIDGSLLWSALVLSFWLLWWSLLKNWFLRRLWKPAFWIATAVVVLLAGLFLGPRDLEWAALRWSSQGLWAGAEMLIRALFIFSFALLINDAFNRKTLERLQKKVGFPQFWTSLHTAMEMLPALMSRAGKEFRNRRGSLRWPGRGMLMRWLKEAVRVAEETAQGKPRMVVSPVVFAVTGARNSGKTTYLRQLADALKARCVDCGGFIQPASVLGGRKVRYAVESIATGESRIVATAREDGTPGYDFEPKTFQWASELWNQDVARTEVCFADELGWLEGEGEGHMPALVGAVEANTATFWVVAVREQVLQPIGKQLPAFVIPVRAWNTPPEHLASSLSAKVHGSS